MAEAYLNTLSGESFHAESAGLIPGVIDSFAIQVMKEENIDISDSFSKSVYSMKEDHKIYNYVIRTCGKEVLKNIPMFPGADDKLCWHIEGTNYSDISSAQKLAITRKIRDEIRTNIIQFINIHKK